MADFDLVRTDQRCNRPWRHPFWIRSLPITFAHCSATADIFELEAGTMVQAVIVHLVEAFDEATTLIVGASGGDTDYYIASTDVDMDGTAGYNVAGGAYVAAQPATGLIIPLAADQTVLATLAGTDSTEGLCRVHMLVNVPG